MHQVSSRLLPAAVFGSLLVLGAPFAHAAATAPYLGVAPQGNAAQGAGDVAVCASCHGQHGNSMAPNFPNLAGQNYNYLLKQLEDFRSGARQNATMSAMIQTVPPAPGDANLQNIARYFSSQTLNLKANANAATPKVPFDLAKEGYLIYQGGVPSHKVPACAACHMPSGLGNAPMAIPTLAGQHATYVENELNLFATGQRHNSAGHVMEVIARRLRPEQRKAVAAYAEVLDPKLIEGIGPLDYATYVKDRASQPLPGVLASALAMPVKAVSKKVENKAAGNKKAGNK